MAAVPPNAVVAGRYRYRIEGLVGSGGMGEVYRATNLEKGTPVAVKFLNRGGEVMLKRFRNEAAIQSGLRHPNVAELYDYCTYQGTDCIVMEFVEGRTLHDWIRETGGLEISQALEIMAAVCDAVSYMHSKGTIHRDIKSENIRIDARDKAKLLDFGIAVGKSTPALTQAGWSVGTPEKMAPEQHQGLRGDARSDVWALGVLLYEMVTGALPFANSSESALRQDILAVRYVPPQKRRPGLPRRLAHIIDTCLRLKPDERYASAGVLLREVQQARRQADRGVWGRFGEINLAYVAAALGLLVVLLIAYAMVSNVTGPASVTPQAIQQTEALPPVEPTPWRGPVSSGPAPEPRGGLGAARRPTPPPGLLPQPAPLLNCAAAVQQEVPGGGVIVQTGDGPADVYLAGQKIGSTPCHLHGPVGQNYELYLRRPGFEQKKVDVTFSATEPERLFYLQEIEH
jgi:serine/threonine-protein kinase